MHMPTLTSYALFISHAWRYNDEYYRLVELLRAAPYFQWRNFSVPQHDPVIDPDTDAGYRQLRKELDDQIRPVNCVLILSGMYATYRKWIQVEMEIAQSYRKPIVGVVPRGQERIPEAVQTIANEMVNWSTSSIVAAIRRQAR